MRSEKALFLDLDRYPSLPGPEPVPVPPGLFCLGSTHRVIATLLDKIHGRRTRRACGRSDQRNRSDSRMADCHRPSRALLLSLTGAILLGATRNTIV
jgi:hypothetical protein